MTCDCAKIIPAFLRETSHFPSLGAYSQPPAAGTGTVLNRGTSFIVSAILLSVQGCLGCAFLGELFVHLYAAQERSWDLHTLGEDTLLAVHTFVLLLSPWGHLGDKVVGIRKCPFYLVLCVAGSCLILWLEKVTSNIFPSRQVGKPLLSGDLWASVQNDLENSSPME